MPHVNPTLPNQGETADATDISTPFAELLAVFNGHIGPDNMEPGSFGWGMFDPALMDAIPAQAMRDGGNLELFRKEANISFIQSGGVWSSVSGLNGAMTEAVFYSGANGKRIKVPAINSHTFTAEKDTYISISSTGSIGFTEVAHNAEAPAISNGDRWLARVTTAGASISSVRDMRQTHFATTQEGYFTSGVLSSGGTIGDASCEGWYNKIGDLVYVNVKITIVNKGTGDNGVLISLPQTIAGKRGRIQVLTGREEGTNGMMLQAKVFDTVMGIFKYDNTFPANNGSTLWVSGTYKLDV